MTKKKHTHKCPNCGNNFADGETLQRQEKVISVTEWYWDTKLRQWICSNDYLDNIDNDNPHWSGWAKPEYSCDNCGEVINCPGDFPGFSGANK